MKNSAGLDAIDRKLLDALQRDGRIAIEHLSERIALSPTPCLRRIENLENTGIIEGYCARLNRARLGYDIHAYVSVLLESNSTGATQSFEGAVLAMSEVLACHNITGQYDYQLEVISETQEAFAHFVRERLRLLPGVKKIYTALSLKTLKSPHIFPL